MNKIVIAGRMARDPELRTTNSGTEVAGFCVAVDRRVRKGEEKIADFVDCTAWGKTGVFVHQYFHKGDGIVLDGRLESRKWEDKQGQKRVSWEIVVDNVEFPLGGKRSDASASSAPAAPGGFEPLANADESDLPF